MANITCFDRSNIRAMRAEMEAALKAVGDKYGLTTGVGRITFTSSEFGCKVTVQTKNANPAGLPPNQAKEEAALHVYGGLYFGQNFDPNGVYLASGVGRVKFVGYSSRRPRYPFTVKCTLTGKMLKISTSLAKAAALNKVA